MSCLATSQGREGRATAREEEVLAAKSMLGDEGCKIVLAPMVRGSELAFRTLVRRHGVRLCFSPMMTARKLLEGDKDELELLEECRVGGEGKGLVVQLAVADPKQLYEAAKLCVRSVPGLGALDLNLGCPQTCAKRGGFGAFLLEERLGVAGGFVVGGTAVLKVKRTEVNGARQLMVGRAQPSASPLWYVGLGKRGRGLV